MNELPKHIRSFAVGNSVGEVLIQDGEDAASLAQVSPLILQLGAMVGNALGLDHPESVLLIGKTVSTLTLETAGNYHSALFDGFQSREVKTFLLGLTELTEAINGGSDVR